MFSCILFDLDGTISDPKQGICGCVQYALRSFGIEEPELDRLEPFIGPPLAESFMKYYNFTAEQAQEAVEKYRERFSVTGKYENVLYPGMGALLHDLKASGATLAIASSKPTVYVEDILVHFGIREYFDIVVGSELDGRRVHKEEVVAEVLSQLAARGESDPDKMVMIGDRSFDVEGAKAIGAHCIAVSYGYAQPGELENAGAEIIVRDVEGLRSVLLGGTQAGNSAQAGSGTQAGNSAQAGRDTQTGNSAQAGRDTGRKQRGDRLKFPFRALPRQRCQNEDQIRAVLECSWNQRTGDVCLLCNQSPNQQRNFDGGIDCVCHRAAGAGGLFLQFLAECGERTLDVRCIYNLLRNLAQKDPVPFDKRNR